MNHKYWEWEAMPHKEKLKRPSLRHLTDGLFENETQAYRFARALQFLKERGVARLQHFPGDLPKATWLRYLEYGVQLGMVDKSGDKVYSVTNRFTNSLRNFADYFDRWRKEGGAEELAVLYPRAEKGRYGGDARGKAVGGEAGGKQIVEGKAVAAAVRQEVE
ncbi:MAG: hypothetical protein AABW54_05145 [Candidatus Micrarchaeota archaeon]